MKCGRTEFFICTTVTEHHRGITGLTLKGRRVREDVTAETCSGGSYQADGSVWVVSELLEGIYILFFTPD